MRWGAGGGGGMEACARHISIKHTLQQKTFDFLIILSANIGRQGGNSHDISSLISSEQQCRLLQLSFNALRVRVIL